MSSWCSAAEFVYLTFFECQLSSPPPESGSVRGEVGERRVLAIYGPCRVRALRFRATPSIAVNCQAACVRIFPERRDGDGQGAENTAESAHDEIPRNLELYISRN